MTACNIGMRDFIRMRPFHLVAFLCGIACGSYAMNSVHAADWQQAAGPNGNFTVTGNAPVEFSVTHERNVLWRAKLPSTGQGTAIVSNGRVFLTSHELITKDTEMGSDILGMCFDAATGKELWRRTIPGVRETDLSSLFSDNTAASPVADGERVCFINVGGAIRCFDFEGRELWGYDWVPFGRHHARLHEPILHQGNVITVQYPHRDLKPEHATKAGAAPLGRDRRYWMHLQAFDLKNGERRWIAETGTSVHQTSLIGRTSAGVTAILTGRGGGHQPPEEPYGLSLVNALDGSTIWELPIAGYPSAQNSCWDGSCAYAFGKDEHFVIDVATGKIVRRSSLIEGVTITRHAADGYVRTENTTLPKFRQLLTKNSNIIAGRFHYFRAGEGFFIGRVNLDSGAVEYLQVPVQIVRRVGQSDEPLWDKALPNDMKTADGFVATQDKRNSGNGWGHVSAASGTVIGDKLYLPTMVGMVHVLNWNAERLDENAVISINDLGPANETWSLSSLSYSDGRLYARTLKELICIGEK